MKINIEETASIIKQLQVACKKAVDEGPFGPITRPNLDDVANPQVNTIAFGLFNTTYTIMLQKVNVLLKKPE